MRKRTESRRVRGIAAATLVIGAVVLVNGAARRGGDPLDRLMPSPVAVWASRNVPGFDGTRIRTEAIESHRAAARAPRVPRKHDAPALYATWFADSRARAAYSFLVYRDGQVWTRRLLPRATQGGGSVALDRQALSAYIAALPSLPDGLSDPPPAARALIVSTGDPGGGWRTRVYDRTNLPPAVRQVVTGAPSLAGMTYTGPGPELPAGRVASR
jgi:hypothetical protein